MTTIIPVHGTFASGPKEGEQWWQRGSSFEAQLHQCLETEGGEVSFEPFVWDGHNSEQSRRQAGDRLLYHCQVLEQKSEPYVLIGHSHGGSVISHALLLASKAGSKLPHLVQVITVGTPFIHVEKAAFLARVPGRIWIVLSALCALALAVFLAITPGTYLNQRLSELDPAFRVENQVPKPGTVKFDPSKSLMPPGYWDKYLEDSNRMALSPEEAKKKEIKDRAADALREAEEKQAAREASESKAVAIIRDTFLGIALIAGIFIIRTLLTELPDLAVIARRNIKQTESFFSSRWLGLGHELDEAVGGLSRALSIKPSEFVLPAVTSRFSTAYITLSVLITLALLAMLAVLLSAAYQIQPDRSGLFIVDLISAVSKSPEKALRIGASVLLIVAVAVAILLCGWVISKLAFAFSASRFDQLFQNVFLGLNVPGQKVTQVKATTMWSESQVVSLPEDVEGELMAFDDEKSIVAVNALRRELYAAIADETSKALPNMGQVVAAFELTHTLYFQSALFRKFLFAALSEAPSFAATAPFAADPDRTRLLAWLAPHGRPGSSPRPVAV